MVLRGARSPTGGVSLEAVASSGRRGVPLSQMHLYLFQRAEPAAAHPETRGAEALPMSALLLRQQTHARAGDPPARGAQGLSSKAGK